MSISFSVNTQRLLERMVCSCAVFGVVGCCFSQKTHFYDLKSLKESFEKVKVDIISLYIMQHMSASSQLKFGGGAVSVLAEFRKWL